jgi:hypothetical protein
MTRRAVILGSAGAAAGVLIGLVLLVNGQVGFGLFFLIGTPAMSAANVFVIKQSVGRQQNGMPRRQGAHTGRTLLPLQVFPPGGAISWTGGASIATDLGRVNASSPLAVLSVTGRTLELRLRPKAIGGLVGSRQSPWQFDELLTIYPVRGKWFRFNQGVAVEAISSPLSYFWTRQPAEVLTVLAQHGLPVDWAERDITLLP